ncbi:acyltransferase family protein [Geodermatophilus sp. URMC 63]
MRGVAALAVVCAHGVDLVESQPHLGPSRIAGLGHLGNSGAIGVDLFFVISGFVMALSVARMSGARDARRFLVLRWLRVAPPFLVACALLICLHTFVGQPYPLPWQAAANATLFVPVVDQVAYTLPVLDVGWTLSFEFTFYLGVAALVLGGQARRAWLLVPALTGLVAVGAVLAPSAFLLRWVTNPIMIEFAFGILAYWLWDRGLLERVRPVWWALGAIAGGVLVAEVVVGYGGASEAGTVLDGSGSTLRVLVWGIPVLFVFLALLPLGRSEGISRAGRLARHLGDSSYSLYLVHMSVFGFLGALLSRLPALPVADVLLPLSVAVAAVAGSLFHRWVEVPINAWVRDRTSRRTGPAPARQHAVGQPAVPAPVPLATQRLVLTAQREGAWPPPARPAVPAQPQVPSARARSGGAHRAAEAAQRRPRVEAHPVHGSRPAASLPLGAPSR